VGIFPWDRGVLEDEGGGRWGAACCSRNLEKLQSSDPAIHGDSEVDKELKQYDLEEKKLGC
jgi:hypothetical protein